MATTGYEDIEKLTQNQNAMLDNALKQQQDITNKQTEMNVAELERNKQEIDKDVTKTNRALYTEYQKANNPYGANAEQLASQGLGNSGYAESTQTNLYNTYQKNVTETLNNARNLKSDFDFQINKARQTGDITLAQNALAIYNQKMQLLTQEYEMRNNREQFLYQQQQDALAQSNWEKQYKYQQERDRVSDDQWQQSFNYQKNRDTVSDNQWQKTFDYNSSRDKASDSQWQKTFDYQKNRDKVSDSQWQKEYELSKKASASSSRKSTSSSSKNYSTSSKKTKSGATSGLKLNEDSSKNGTQSKETTKNSKKEYTAKEILSKVKNIQGPNKDGTTISKVQDGISGKIFDNITELLKYYDI